jgi:F-type H+-transporting ATPase subunit delta
MVFSAEQFVLQARLAQESRTKIEDIVTKVTRKKVILSFVEDAKLIGGTVAQVGGWTFDDSLESHLRRLNEDLNRRMS